MRKKRPQIRQPRRQSTIDEFRFVGVDEAGRGPVIGPMVIAICALTERDRRWCVRHGVTDSKAIPLERREALAVALKERCWHHLVVIQPPEIDEAVRNRNVTLNGLEMKYMAELIKTFRQAFPDTPAEVMLDAPTRKMPPFRRMISYLSDWDDYPSLKAENFADQNYRHVGAASILAKTERDRFMRELAETLGQDIGCGYAHDSLSRAYVEQAAKDNPHVRWSWSTADDQSPKLNDLMEPML